LLAQFNPERVIDLEQFDGHPADRRAAHQVRPFPPKMSRPFMPTRVEERRELARPRVPAADVRTLKHITIIATQAKVASDRRPGMLPGNNVVNLKSGVVV